MPRKNRSKNPGIGRGGRPGMMPPAKRFLWIYNYVHWYGPVTTNHIGFRIRYLYATGIRDFNMLGKDLSMMYELGMLDRICRVRNRCGLAYMYAISEYVRVAA